MIKRLSKLTHFALAGLLTAGGLGLSVQAQATSFKTVAGKSPAPVTVKMTSEFYSLVSMLGDESPESRRALSRQGHKERACPLFRLKDLSTNEQAIETYIWLESWDESIRHAVEKAGAEIEFLDADRYLLQAWVPLSVVNQVAQVQGVRQLRRPSYALPAAGSVTTQGDTLLGTNFVRNMGNVNGLGLRVGVLSQGLFGSYYPSSRVQNGGANADARVQSGDLPENEDSQIRTGYLGAVELIPQSPDLHDINKFPAIEMDQNGIPEGAAILEILYDMAPAADYIFAGCDTDIELKTYRDVLLNKDVDVMVDDLVFYDSGRFDGSSVISRQAQDIVLNKDVVYVVATGNQTPPNIQTDETLDLSVEARRFPIFINSRFAPLPGYQDSRFHNFASGREPGAAVRDLALEPSNGVIDVLVVWDDVWDDQNPHASDDFDLYLFPKGHIDAGEIIASSVDLQNGTTGRPIERITAYLGGGDYSLVLSRKDVHTASPAIFTIVLLQGTVSNNYVKYITHGIAGNNGDALPPVITVGSIDAEVNINQVDRTTVPGVNPGAGRNWNRDFVKWFTTQETPAVVSYTNVSTLTTLTTNQAGQRVVGPLTGSSAAAAHVGGLVTLLRHSFRTVPSWQFYDLLREDQETGENQGFTSATRLEEETLSDYENPPVYYRVNGFDSFLNIRDKINTGTLPAKSQMAVQSPGWETSAVIEPFNQPFYAQTSLGLEISPNGQQNVFGFWQTPVLALVGSDGVETTQLRTDKIYELTVRVGSDESDPASIPDFRIRLTSGGNDESSLKVVAGLEAQNAPTTIAGNTYKLYYRASSEAVAAQGVRFAFDLIHFTPTDNSNATLYVNDIVFKELSHLP